ncbi:MAG TPA: hypothetical protein VD886_14965, partial [Herpetosiphonaceae bacterium]|nr:hypothetical protein [Herpetosiphonaceae bacterium]
ATAADGTLYGAADFSPQTQKPLRIARWDGGWQELSALGGEGLGGPIRDMLVAPDGSIYAAGEFWHAGATRAAGVARWDGAQWHAIGSGGLHGWVDALALGPDGSLYAGGEFWIGNNYTVQVARWDGVQWTSLGGEIMDPNAGGIAALAVGPDNTVYVGGFLGNAQFSNIGRWNGSQWQSVGAGLGDIESGTVTDLLIAGDGSLYAGGHFDRVNGADVQASVARWDGANWQAIDGLTGAEDWPRVNELALRAGSLYAVGHGFAPDALGAGVARWDGTQWQPIESSNLQGEFQYLWSLAFDQAGNLYVGGLFSQIGAVPARNIARWDGSQWHALGAGVNGRVRRLVVDGSGRLFAGGSFTMAGTAGSGRIARWTAGDGRCGLAPNVPAVFYAQNQPVAVTVRTPGTLACVSVQRIDASHPGAPDPLETGAHWAIHGTDQAGAPATGAVFDLSLPRPADSGDDDQACWLGIAWNCAADSLGPDAVTYANASAFGIWARADAALPGATWELAGLAVNTSALTSSAILTYTLSVGAEFGGHYTATLDLHPALSLLDAPEMQSAGNTLSATGVVTPGQIRPYVITVAVSPSFSGTISQTAQISGGAQDRTLSAPPVAIAPSGEPSFKLYLPNIRR